MNDGVPPYGNMVALNTSREVLDAVGEDALREFVLDYLDLLGTSAAVYETNGDYAQGIFSSGWCRFLDQVSRANCGTADNREALKCGKWSCHESCWETSRTSMRTRSPADLPCAGGIRIYAVPIEAGDEVVGAINFGYGDPPQDEASLKEIASTYGKTVPELREMAATHPHASAATIEMAKRRLHTAAQLIGALVERQRAQRLFQSTFEQAAVGIAHVGIDGRWLRVNQKLCDVVGYSREELLAGTIQAITHPDDLATDLEHVRRLLAGDIKNYAMEKRYLRKDGSTVWINLTASLVRSALGAPEYFIAVIDDISRRRQSEEALRTTEARLRRVSEANLIGIVVSDAAGTIVDANAAFLRLTGYSREEMLSGGVRWPDLTPPEHRAGDEQAVAQLRASGTTVPWEKVCLRKDGSRVPVLVGLSPLNGKPEAHVAFVLDLSARHEAEQRLRRTQDRLESVVSHSPAVIYASSPGADFKLHYMSPNVRDKVGYDADELMRNPELWITGLHPEDRDRVLGAFEQQVPKGAVAVEYRFRAKDGSWHWLRDEATVVFDPAGHPVEMVGYWTDITSRREAERRLQTTESMLHQSQKMEAVGRLAGGVAHDFNNLLTVINGYSQLALDKLDPLDPIRGTMEEVRKAGERATSLTRQLLAFSRKQVVQPRVVDLNQIVSGAERLLRRLIGEDIDLCVAPCPLPVCIMADPGQVEQILVNIAVNARDAMPEGGKLTIETKVQEVDEDYAKDHPGVTAGTLAMLAITDTGTGMTDEVKAHLFEPFFTTKREGRGTGLGLATVYGIVQQCNGHISVYSELGKGSCFKVKFPSVASDAKASIPPVQPAPVRGSETILLVEDQREVRQFISVLLRRNGYAVLEASDGADALVVATEHLGPIDLILTDVVMPHVGGHALAERLASTPFAKKILFMSGYTERAITHGGELKAGLDFIEKPFAPQDRRHEPTKTQAAPHRRGEREEGA